MSTLAEPEEIPYEVQVCQRCKSTEIYRTTGFHPFGRWRCRECDRAFLIPSLQIKLLPVGQDPPAHWQ